jgi:hypothetical protein
MILWSLSPTPAGYKVFMIVSPQNIMFPLLLWKIIASAVNMDKVARCSLEQFFIPMKGRCQGRLHSHPAHSPSQIHRVLLLLKLQGLTEPDFLLLSRSKCTLRILLQRIVAGALSFKTMNIYLSDGS